MGRQNIFTTLNVAAVMPLNMRNDLINFLINNRQNFLTSQKKTDAFKHRFSGQGPISDIVHRIATLGKDQTYNLINIPQKSTPIREVIDMTFVPWDILQLKEVTPAYTKTLSLIPELDDKIVINVSDIMRNNGDFSDISQLQWRIVRDFLSRSFYISSGNVWILPALVRYVAKVYSMTIGVKIARFFGLSPLLQTFIQTVFGLYFVGRMTSVEIAPDFVRSHYRSMGIINPQELVQIFAFVEDVLGKKSPETLDEVLKVIDEYGHDRLKDKGVPRLSRSVLNTKFSNLFPESHIATTSLEYPPYFFFMILLVLSNVRIGLSFTMKDMNLVNEGRDVVEQMMKSHLFTNGI